MAFVVGSLAAALLFAPNILGGSAARLAEQALDRKWDGRVEIGSMDLAWTQPQTFRGLKLFDPAGEEVLRGNLTLPGFLKWDSSEGIFHASFDVLELNVRRDMEGVSGLARAVGRGQVPWPQAPLDWSLAEFRAGDGLAQGRPYELAWNLGLGQWRDERRPGYLLRVHGVRGHISHGAHGKTVLTASGEVSLGGLEGHFDVLWERAQDGELSGHLIAEGLPSGVLAELAQGLAELPMWCGMSVDLKLLLGKRALEEAQQEPVAGAGLALLVELENEHTQGRLLGRWVDGTLRSGEGGLATFEAQLSGEVCKQLGARGLPEFLVLEPGEGLTWRWSARDFAWPLGGGALAAPAVYTLEGQVLGELALANASGQVLARLADGRFELTKAEQSPGLLKTSMILREASQDSERPGARVEYSLRAESGGGWPWAGPDVSYSLDSYGMSGATLDTVLGLDGLLLEILGEDVEGHASGSLRALRPKPHRFSLAGADGLLLEGLEFEGGRLRFAQGESRRLELPLGPRLAEVLLQPALPMLATIEPLANVLRVEATDLELAWADGRAYLTAGELVLDPGEVKVRLHPGLAGLFEAEPDPVAVPIVLLPVRLRVEGSLLRYVELTLPLAGEECDLLGTFDRSNQRLAFTTEASLSVAAHKLALPEAARSVLAGSAYIMEMTIGGTLSEPSLNFSAEVVGEFMNGGLQQLLSGTPISLLKSAVQSLVESDD